MIHLANDKMLNGERKTNPTLGAYFCVIKAYKLNKKNVVKKFDNG